MGLRDPQAMILMDPTTLVIVPTIDFLLIGNFKVGPQDACS